MSGSCAKRPASTATRGSSPEHCPRQASRWAGRRSCLRISHKPLKDGPATACRSLLSVWRAASGASPVRHPAAPRPGTAPACSSHHSRRIGFCDSARSRTSGTCKAAVPAQSARPRKHHFPHEPHVPPLLLGRMRVEPKEKLARGTTALTGSNMRPKPLANP